VLGNCSRSARGCSRIERMFPSQRTRSPCLFPGCGRPMYAKGLCQSHYCQQLRTGSLWPLGSRRQLRVACHFEGCDKPATTRRLCPGHYKQLQKGQPLRPLRPFYGKKGVCRYEGCGRPRFNGGWCVGHAAQYYSGRPSRLFSGLRWTATFPAVRSLTTHWGIVRAIGGKC
jgi:hypothetical protein